MMEKKLCLTLIVFFIDFLYAERTEIVHHDKNNNNKILVLEHNCGPNEILGNNEKICELTCDVPTPLLRCLKKETPYCICSDGYVRNDLKTCVLSSECPQEMSGEKILSVGTNFNWTQDENLEENQNITLLDDGKIVRDVQEHLSQRLNTFLHLLRNRTLTNSGRNVRHTNSAEQNVEHNYQYYMSLLRASSEQSSGLELNW